MPANHSPRPLGRRENDPDPFNVDMTEVPMTPAMTALHEIAQLRALVAKAERYLDECTLDATQLTLAEGQTMTFVMRAQGRPFSWRAQLAKILERRRGINVASQNWRSRTRELNPEKTPSYMNATTLDQIREHIEPLAALIEDAEAKRDKQYPTLLKRTKAAIEAPVAKAS